MNPFNRVILVSFCMKFNFNITNYKIKFSIVLLVLFSLFLCINKSNTFTKISNKNANSDHFDDVTFIVFTIEQNRPFSRYYDSDIMNAYDFFSEEDQKNISNNLYEIISYLESIKDVNESDKSHTVVITYLNSEYKNISKNISPSEFNYISLKLINSKLSKDRLRFIELIDMMKDHEIAVNPNEMSTDR